MVYVFVDVGNPIWAKNIVNLHERKLDAGAVIPDLIVIDSTAKDSASIA